MQSSAYLEFAINSNLEAAGQSVSYAGYVQCFCDAEALTPDYDRSTLYTPTAESTDEGLPVCKDYLDSLFVTFAMSNAVMVTIIVINIILKEITIALITWIGYDTFSELMTKIVNGVFISLFFNTGILLILVNANFSEVSLGLGLTSAFKGPFPDYTVDWYNVVGGTLVSTMLLNAFMPPLYEF